ncbi:MAG: hypothetical protein ACOC3Z_01250 [Nanoarchaeota archaeon]
MNKLTKTLLISFYSVSLFLFSRASIDSSITNQRDSFSINHSKERVLHKIPWEKDFDKIPIKSEFNLSERKCSAYALLSARKNFNKEYFWKDAWNLRHFNQTISLNNKDLSSLVRKGVLEQGHLVGFYYPNSNENGKIDTKGDKRLYTHVAVYMGKNEEGKFIFDHQIGKRQERKTFSELSKNYSMKPIEIIHPIK